MQSLMKTALGPAIIKLAKLKTEDSELIEDEAEQLERWVEHYSIFMHKTFMNIQVSKRSYPLSAYMQMFG